MMGILWWICPSTNIDGDNMDNFECICECKNCEFADKLYFKDSENGKFYEYKTLTIVNCMKYNDFVIGGEFLSNL